MDLSKLPLFAALTRRMDWLNERQRTLAHNIANSDTPGFQPRDLKPVAFADMLRGAGAGGKLQAAVTDPSHLVAAPQTTQRVETQKRTYETAPAGNAVVLEEQLMKLAETQIDYTTTTNLYRKHVGLLKIALGKR